MNEKAVTECKHVRFIRRDGYDGPICDDCGAPAPSKWSEKAVVIPEDLRERWKLLTSWMLFDNPEKRTPRGIVPAEEIKLIERIATLQAEVDALKKENFILDDVSTQQAERIAELKAEVARRDAPVTEEERDKGNCSPRCVAYEAGDRFAISHEEGCPNGGSKLSVKFGNFCTVPGCRFPYRHSTEVHREHLAAEQRRATPPQDVENGGKQ